MASCTTAAYNSGFRYLGTQLIVATCTDNDLQNKVPVLPCITDLWNNKECARWHINERCRMQGAQRVPLVSLTRSGVIDRRANYILGALVASFFLFPIGQRRPRGALLCRWMYLHDWGQYTCLLIINSFFRICLTCPNKVSNSCKYWHNSQIVKTLFRFF